MRWKYIRILVVSGRCRGQLVIRFCRTSVCLTWVWFCGTSVVFDVVVVFSNSCAFDKVVALVGAS